MTTRLRRLAMVMSGALLGCVVVACSGGPILANPAASLRPEPAASPAPSTAVDPVPIQLPLDDGAHQRLTEWWYYT
ncbi:MAG: hypothetical protein ACRDGI_02500, partial [Candidatus Limnocylindrales bacterium]